MVLRRLFMISLPLYFSWEMLQMPASGGLPGTCLGTTPLCALATIGDAAVVALLYAIGMAAFRDARWFTPPRLGRYAAIVTAGIVLQIAIEWAAVYQLAWWSYGDAQPIVPGLGIGIFPLLQPVVLLPLTFWLLGRSLTARH